MFLCASVGTLQKMGYKIGLINYIYLIKLPAQSDDMIMLIINNSNNKGFFKKF